MTLHQRIEVIVSRESIRTDHIVCMGEQTSLGSRGVGVHLLYRGGGDTRLGY